MTMHCIYWSTTTTKNPPIIRPHIVFTNGRQQRQIQPFYDHILCLLMDDETDKSNLITTTCCVYWLTTTTTNPTITPPLIVFTDERKQRQTQPWYRYDHALCLLTDEKSDNPNHNTTMYCVYWRTNTTTNQTMIPLHIMFTDERQQQ